MKGTLPAGGTQYGAANVLYPGKRPKNHNFDTSVGSAATTVALNATVNAARVAVDNVIKAQRVVTNVRTGLALRAES